MVPDLVPKFYLVKRFKINENLKRKWDESNQIAISSSEESSSEDEDPPSKKSKLEIPQKSPEHAQSLQNAPEKVQKIAQNAPENAQKIAQNAPEKVQKIPQKSPDAVQNLQKSPSPNSPIVQFKPGTSLEPETYVYQNI